MEISVSCSALRKGLQQVLNVIPGKTTLPILSHVLIEAGGSQITLSATDLEISLRTSVDATVTTTGSIAIPCHLLTNVVKELPDITLNLKIEDGNRILLTSSRGKYTFFGEDAKDFPHLPTVEILQEVTFSKSILKRHIEKTIFAVSRDELRAALMGVLFQVKDGELMTVATDGHRLVRVINKAFSETENINDVIVPEKALSLLVKSLDEDGEIKISFANNYVTFELENATLNASLIDARYPEYEKVIPNENENLLTVNRNDFISALRTISVLANKITQQIKMSIESDNITLISQDMDRGEGIEKINVDYSGTQMEIGFNSTYLLDILRHIDTDDVTFKLGTPTNAVLAFPSTQNNDEDILMLVMPIKLRD